MTNRPWPSAAVAKRWAVSWSMDAIAVDTPPELRGMAGENYRRERDRLIAAGVLGAREDDRISARALSAVLVEIADWYGIDGPWAWSAVATIAGRIGKGERTVTRAVRTLERAGLIVRRRWWDSTTGGRLPNRCYLPLLYDVDVPDGPVAAARDTDYHGDGQPFRPFRPIERPSGTAAMVAVVSTRRQGGRNAHAAR